MEAYNKTGVYLNYDYNAKERENYRDKLERKSSKKLPAAKLDKAIKGLYRCCWSC